jgi:hypothetical protein
MRSKIKLLGGLSVIVVASSLIAATPSVGDASPAPIACTNSWCSPLPNCHFELDWNCFMEGPNTCAGNESCDDT